MQRFTELVDYYDRTGPKKDGKATGDLRGEALQYTAISFADEKWGSVEKAKATFARMGGRPYEAEVYRRMGDVYFDQTRHPEAIASYRLALQKDPLAVDAPKIQQKIVQAYERDRKLNEAFAESEALANAYAPGTPWYEKHKNDPEVLAATLEMTEKNLYGSAVYHHQQALALKQQGKLEAARTMFESAAKGYEGYLQRFPRSKPAYEVQFFAAECQYNSLQFAKAAKNYDAIRDNGSDDRYRKDAAYGAVLAWTKLIEQLQDSKKLARYPVLRSKDRPEGEKPQSIPLAPEEVSLIAATDAFLQLSPRDERAPGAAYRAAELLYAHNQFPEARQRFEEIIQTYPKSEVSKYATNLTVETFLIDKDWRSVEEVSARLAQNTEVIDPKSELYKDLVKFKLAGRFKLADELMAQGAWDEAAKKYIQLVDEEPKHEFADKALNNAAVCYEKDHRFESALKLYERIIKEYPNSKLADAALFRVAVNQENSYDFDRAVQSYERLVKEYPASKDREAALYNAARLLEGQQKYSEAAAAYSRYADLFPKAEDAPKNQYRAALVYEKQGDTRNEIKALNEFVRRFGGKANQAELVVEAHKKLGDAYAKSGNPKDARKAWETAAREFDRRGLKPEAALQGADAAAESRFQVSEQDLQRVRPAEDRRAGQGARAELHRQARRGEEGAVDATPRSSSTSGWSGRWPRSTGRATSLERFGATINETPVPPDVKRLGRRGSGRLPGPPPAADRGARGQGRGELRRHPRAGEEEPGQQRVDEEDARGAQPVPAQGVPGAQGPQAGHRHRRDLARWAGEHRGTQGEGAGHPGQGRAARASAPASARAGAGAEGWHMSRLLKGLVVLLGAGTRSLRARSGASAASAHHLRRAHAGGEGGRGQDRPGGPGGCGHPGSHRQGHGPGAERRPRRRAPDLPGRRRQKPKRRRSVGEPGGHRRAQGRRRRGGGRLPTCGANHPRAPRIVGLPRPADGAHRPRRRGRGAAPRPDPGGAHRPRRAERR